MNMRVTRQQFLERMKAVGWEFEPDDSLFADMEKAGFLLIDEKALLEEKLRQDAMLKKVPKKLRSKDYFVTIENLLGESQEV